MWLGTGSNYLKKRPKQTKLQTCLAIILIMLNLTVTILTPHPWPRRDRVLRHFKFYPCQHRQIKCQIRSCPMLIPPWPSLWYCPTQFHPPITISYLIKLWSNILVMSSSFRHSANSLLRNTSPSMAIIFIHMSPFHTNPSPLLTISSYNKLPMSILQILHNSDP